MTYVAYTYIILSLLGLGVWLGLGHTGKGNDLDSWFAKLFSMPLVWPMAGRILGWR